MSYLWCFLAVARGLRISQNSVTTNFVEFTFFALGCIKLVALLEVRTGLGCRDGSNVPEEGPALLLRGSGPSSMRPWGVPQDVGASRLRRSWLSETLARAFGLGHGALVEQSPKHPPDNRTKDVEPETRKIPGNYHRSQRARWVYRPSGNGSCDEDSYR